jgi:hypothetical protein
MALLTLRTEIDIDGSVERVWEVLTDFEAYPRWNPFIRRIDGVLAPRARLRVRIHPPGGKAITFRPVLLRVEPDRQLSWLGRTLIPGLFDGEHVFQMEPAAPGHVRFVHGETFRGLLVPLLASTLRTTTRRGFELMNAALKERVERHP